MSVARGTARPHAALANEACTCREHAALTWWRGYAGDGHRVWNVIVITGLGKDGPRPRRAMQRRVPCTDLLKPFNFRRCATRCCSDAKCGCSLLTRAVTCPSQGAHVADRVFAALQTCTRSQLAALKGLGSRTTVWSVRG